MRAPPHTHAQDERQYYVPSHRQLTMAVYIELQGNTTLTGKQTTTTPTEETTKREPPHTALRGITGRFASSDEPFD